MMKQKSRGLFALLIVGWVVLLTGCVGQERYTYVMHDSDGCAYLVTRWVSGDDAGRADEKSRYLWRAISRDWWNGDEVYTAQIQRLSHDDQPTCKLSKE